jgi:hypothetical protein
MQTTDWLDSPALAPGGALMVEKRAALGAFEVVPGRLVAQVSGVHQFRLDGARGVTLQAKVATEMFTPVVVVVSPSGVRWDVSSGARAPDTGGTGGQAEAEGHLELPEGGAYTLLVTSEENLTAGKAVTTAGYRLTLLCDAPRKITSSIPKPPPSSRSGRFGAWESEPR